MIITPYLRAKKPFARFNDHSQSSRTISWVWKI